MTDKKTQDEQTNAFISSMETIFTSLLDFAKAYIMAHAFFSDRAINSSFGLTLVVVINALFTYFKNNWKTNILQKLRKMKKTHGILKIDDLKSAQEQAKEEGPYVAVSWPLTEENGRIFGLRLFKAVGHLLTTANEKMSTCLSIDTKAKTPVINGVMLGLFHTEISYGIKNLLTGVNTGHIFPVYVTKKGNYICLTKNDTGQHVLLFKLEEDLQEFYDFVLTFEIEPSLLEMKHMAHQIHSNSNCYVIMGDGEKETKIPFPAFSVKDWVSDKKVLIFEMLKHFKPDSKQHIVGSLRNFVAMITGPPGTGKSSLARVLSTMFNRPIYQCHFTSIERGIKVIEDNKDKIVIFDEFNRFMCGLEQEPLNKKDVEGRKKQKEEQIKELREERMKILAAINAASNKENPGIRMSEQRVNEIDMQIKSLSGTNDMFGNLLSRLDLLNGAMVLFCSNTAIKLNTALHRRFNLITELQYFNKPLILEMVHMIYKDSVSEAAFKEFAEAEFPTDRYTGSNIESLAAGKVGDKILTFDDFENGKLKLRKLKELMTDFKFYPETQDEESKIFADKSDEFNKNNSDVIKKQVETFLKSIETKKEEGTIETKTEKANETVTASTETATTEKKNETVAGPQQDTVAASTDKNTEEKTDKKTDKNTDENPVEAPNESNETTVAPIEINEGGEEESDNEYENPEAEDDDPKTTEKGVRKRKNMPK